MSEPKRRSPKPWVTRECRQGWCVYSALTGKAVTGWGCVTQTKVDADLIAAAPDFLAACKAAIAATEHINAFATDKRMTAALELMRAAIRKAEGEPQ